MKRKGIFLGSICFILTLSTLIVGGKALKKDGLLKKEDLVELNPINNQELSYEVINNINSEDIIGFNSNNYTNLEGIITFRGDNFRSKASWGNVTLIKNKLELIWDLKTSASTWGGGSGWTGQPAIVKWPEELRISMNINEKFKNKDEFTEVIYGSLDGNIYFMDLETGEPSREKIRVNNPIKGSVSLDPRGIPLLYVGEGINEDGEVGYNIYSLIDSKKLFELDGNDPDCDREWRHFDSSALVDAKTDTLMVGGENGLFYRVKLNTNYDKENNSIEINPEVSKLKYTPKVDRGTVGIENSICTYKNLTYFADNNGYVVCVDSNTLQPIWIVDCLDDTDASLVLEVEVNEDGKEVPYIYTGNEVDYQGEKGIVNLRKMNGYTGEIVWENTFECLSILNPKPVNGGLLATPVIGKNNLKDLVIFSLSRYETLYGGLTVAINKSTGKIVWEKQFNHYAWSSPVDIYTAEGNGYIIQCDSAGNIFLIDGLSGEILDKINVGFNIESSPVVFENTIVVGSRGGKFYGIKIK